MKHYREDRWSLQAERVAARPGNNLLVINLFAGSTKLPPLFVRMHPSTTTSPATGRPVRCCIPQRIIWPVPIVD